MTEEFCVESKLTDVRVEVFKHQSAVVPRLSHVQVDRVVLKSTQLALMCLIEAKFTQWNT